MIYRKLRNSRYSNKKAVTVPGGVTREFLSRANCTYKHKFVLLIKVSQKLLSILSGYTVVTTNGKEIDKMA
jgi:hypothetical protein